MIGKRLKQARLLANLTQDELVTELARSDYSITKAAISKYENGKSIPSPEMLLLATSILDVPSAYFTHEPTLAVNWLAFRRHRDLPIKEQETVKAYATDIAELQVELQTLLYPEINLDFPAPQTVTTFTQAEDMAMVLRDQWELDKHPIDSLVQTVEDRQVIVIAWDRNGGQFDGLSGWCDNRPVTVISTDVDVDRRRFNLAHELGHLMMDTTSVSDKEEEKLAHRFAAAFLVPADRAIYELGARRTRIDLGELMMLKRKYGLSMSAWIYRAKDLGIISRHHASELYKEMAIKGWRKREPLDYIGDENPIQLIQMAGRAVAEGLIPADRIERVCPDCLAHERYDTQKKHLTVYDLMNMSETERQAIIDEAFALAAEDNFEMFEAHDMMDFNDDAF